MVGDDGGHHNARYDASSIMAFQNHPSCGLLVTFLMMVDITDGDI